MPLAPEALDVDGQQHVVEHAPPGEEHGRLEDHADVLARPGDGGAAQPRLARGGGQDAGEYLDQRGLAAAGGSNHSDELPVSDGEGDLLERRHRPGAGGIALGEGVHGDDEGAHGGRLLLAHLAAAAQAHVDRPGTIRYRAFAWTSSSPSSPATTRSTRSFSGAAICSSCPSCSRRRGSSSAASSLEIPSSSRRASSPRRATSTSGGSTASSSPPPSSGTAWATPSGRG